MTTTGEWCATQHRIQEINGISAFLSRSDAVVDDISTSSTSSDNENEDDDSSLESPSTPSSSSDGSGSEESEGSEEEDSDNKREDSKYVGNLEPLCTLVFKVYLFVLLPSVRSEDDDSSDSEDLEGGETKIYSSSRNGPSYWRPARRKQPKQVYQDYRDPVVLEVLFCREVEYIINFSRTD